MVSNRSHLNRPPQDESTVDSSTSSGVGRKKIQRGSTREPIKPGRWLLAQGRDDEQICADMLSRWLEPSPNSGTRPQVTSPIRRLKRVIANSDFMEMRPRNEQKLVAEKIADVAQVRVEAEAAEVAAKVRHTAELSAQANRRLVALTKGQLEGLINAFFRHRSLQTLHTQITDSIRAGTLPKARETLWNVLHCLCHHQHQTHEK